MISVFEGVMCLVERNTAVCGAAGRACGGPDQTFFFFSERATISSTSPYSFA
jgi:hypothetical protein